MKPKRLSYNHGEIGIDTNTYNQEVENISKRTRLEIYNTICNIITNPDSYKGISQEKSGIDTYTLMQVVDGVKFYYTKKNIGGENNAGSVIVEVDNKKYFCKLYNYKDKKYNPFKDPAREFHGIDKTSQAGYKTLKPLIYYKNDEIGVIVYPYVEEMNTLLEGFVGNKIEKEKRDEYKAYVDKAGVEMNKVKVKDLKLANTYIDKHGDLVFFDAIFLGKQDTKHKLTEKADRYI